MRHSYASAVVRNGAPLLVVAETIRRTAPDLDVAATSVVPLARSASARLEA